MSEYSPEDYAKATKLNAKLAIGYDAHAVTEAREVAGRLIEYVRSKVADFDEFVQKVERSERFSLHESAQLKKQEKDLKVIYTRAAELLTTAAEAQQRGR